ncbi:hypothetical protein GJ700_06165 [Duganella sp. FT92W]|uniref:DUF1311 domain-containing protein n=1 Tax=Pseudoduganella rivuli TaxID=2666085 RepID=A0A7X2IK38_9BURK|nr:hypothetical protein [Pseudoduganella rivuli]
MKQVAVLLSAAILCSPALAMGAETDPRQNAECPQPEFPPRSTSTESVRRVEKSLKAWRACFRAAAGQQQNVDDMLAASREYQQVKARHEAWVAATIHYSNGQAYGRLASARVERDFWENLMAKGGNARAVSRRPDETAVQQMAVSVN